MSQVFNNEVKAVLTGFLKQQKTPEKLTPTLKPLLGGRSGAGLYTFVLEKQKYVLRMFAAMEERSGRERESKVTSRFCAWFCT